MKNKINNIIFLISLGILIGVGFMMLRDIERPIQPINWDREPYVRQNYTQNGFHRPQAQNLDSTLSDDCKEALQELLSDAGIDGIYIDGINIID